MLNFTAILAIVKVSEGLTYGYFDILFNLINSDIIT